MFISIAIGLTSCTVNHDKIFGGMQAQIHIHFYTSSIESGQDSLQRDHDSPCTKDVRSSLVAMASPIKSLLPGRKSPA